MEYQADQELIESLSDEELYRLIGILKGEAARRMAQALAYADPPYDELTGEHRVQ